MTTPPDTDVEVDLDEPEVLGAPEARRTRTRLGNPLGEQWDRLPLRARLVGLLVVLLIAALALTGVATQYVLHRYLVGKVDAQLTASAPGVVAALQNRGGFGDEDQRRGSLASYAILYTFDDGTTPRTDYPADRAHPSLPALTRAEAAKRQHHPYTVGSLSGDTHWRVITVPVPSEFGEFDTGQSGAIQIALPLDGVEDATTQLRWLVVLFGLLVTALFAALGWLAIRRALAPLTEVEDTAAAIAAGDLSQRVPERPTSTEVGRLTASLNGMLSQIESAFRSREASEARTRRFAADASHELRTPLASIRGFAELYRQGAVREEEDVARTMGRIEDEARRMGGLVEDLLMLARLDEQRPVRSEPVDLLVLAGDATHDAHGLAPDRAVTLTGLTPQTGPASAVVTGDDARLRQVVTNLVANAVRHTPAGTPIEVAVGRTGSVAVLEIRDHGPGLDPEHAVKVFERFYRVDASRARSQGGGSGLGLSIVAAVVSVHGGRVGVAPTPGGGATFRVELPLRPAEDGPDDEGL